MKEIIKAFFNAEKTEKEEKISDKALISKVTVSVVLIVICLIAMSISAYAYFAHNVSSQAVIKSASYDLAVTPPEGMESLNTYELKNETDEDKEYIFSISTVGTNTTASVGYCKIIVKTDANDGQNQVFYTKPIWRVEATDKPATRTVTIIVPAGKTVYVSFVAEWGSCSQTPIIEEVISPVFNTQ